MIRTQVVLLLVADFYGINPNDVQNLTNRLDSVSQSSQVCGRVMPYIIQISVKMQWKNEGDHPRAIITPHS